jgi:serine/threonine-protein kinase
VANDPLFSPQSWADAANASHFALEPGVLLAEKYRLIRPAGFGGSGAVWVARNEATNAEVAVKVLVLSREGVDDETIARFRREAYAAAQLYHRGIVRVFDLVELTEPEEALIMVMELLRGETLANQMDRKRKFTLDETLAVVLPLLSALAHAHAQGIVHRDLKPENVFLAVDPDGHVTPKILDFGISKLLQPAAPKITTDGAMLGTPNYMSPEQARGRADVDARSDVFAAGILLYEMLSGENPFASGSYHSVVAAILERDPPPLTDLSPEVWGVLKRALEKPAPLRYADATELGAALVRAAKSVGAQTPEASGAFPAMGRPSFGDRSVPPAPFREPEVTIPSMYRAAQNRGRAVRVVAAAVSVAAVLVVAGIYARVTRAHDDADLPARAPAVTPPATAAVLIPPPDPALATAVPVTTATAIVTTTPTPVPSATSTHHSGHTAAPSGGAASRPKATPPPAGSGPTKPSVVRDPGF